jgi:hypothetical protein
MRPVSGTASQFRLKPLPSLVRPSRTDGGPDRGLAVAVDAVEPMGHLARRFGSSRRLDCWGLGLGHGALLHVGRGTIPRLHGEPRRQAMSRRSHPARQRARRERSCTEPKAEEASWVDGRRACRTTLIARSREDLSGCEEGSWLGESPQGRPQCLRRRCQVSDLSRLREGRSVKAIACASRKPYGANPAPAAKLCGVGAAALTPRRAARRLWRRTTSTCPTFGGLLHRFAAGNRSWRRCGRGSRRLARESSSRGAPRGWAKQRCLSRPSGTWVLRAH